MPAPGNFQKCGWGVFGLEHWNPLTDQAHQSYSGSGTGGNPDLGIESRNRIDGSREEYGADKTVGKKLLAKYSYQAQTPSPLGEPELSLMQGDYVALISKHGTEHQHWWLVENGNGETGYAPASYMMDVLDEKPTTLPWLQSRKTEEPVSNPGSYKPYVSAYAKESEETTNETTNDQFYCALCDKRLNGPKPYGAHMNSKAHKENVAYYGED